MATAGGLFGAAGAQPKTGLFGASTTTQAPASGGGLFGNSTATPSAQQPQQGQAAPASGGLFGSAAAQPKPAGSLFGGAAAQPATNTTKTTNTGLFGGGSTATQQPAQTGGGLFGNAQQGGATTGTSAFGQSQAKPSGGLLYVLSKDDDALVSLTPPVAKVSSQHKQPTRFPRSRSTMTTCARDPVSTTWPSRYKTRWHS